MRKNVHRTRLLAGLVTFLCVQLVAAHIASAADDDALMQRAHALATAAVPDQSDPKFYAALRYYLARQADNMDLSHGINSARALQVDPPAATRNSTSVISLDKDPDYQKWLLQQPAAIDLSSQKFGKLGIRSIGGTVIKDGDGNKQFDSVILLRGPDERFCSGVLLSSNLAVTAGHCLCPSWPDYAKTGNDPSTARAPMPGLNGAYQGPGLDCMQQDDTLAGHDYALVLLDQPVSPQPAMLAPTSVLENLAAGGTIWIVGFGAMDVAGTDTPAPKNLIRAPIVSPSCGRVVTIGAAGGARQTDAALYKCVPGSELVSTHILNTSGKDTTGGPCHGDSGGAVFARSSEAVVGGSNQTLYLIGIVSRVVNRDGTCGDATVYTLLTDKLVGKLRDVARNNFNTSFPQ